MLLSAICHSPAGVEQVHDTALLGRQRCDGALHDALHLATLEPFGWTGLLRHRFLDLLQRHTGYATAPRHSVAVLVEHTPKPCREGGWLAQ
jgi:hypothetical protein